jgi:protein-L-isoaspartate(D-aspartate) O-methyltransferase
VYEFVPGASSAQRSLLRAVVIYRPETKLASHYFQATLSQQFNEYILLDQTKAVTPFDTRWLKEMPDTYPFGL